MIEIYEILNLKDTVLKINKQFEIGLWMKTQKNSNSFINILPKVYETVTSMDLLLFGKYITNETKLQKQNHLNKKPTFYIKLLEEGFSKFPWTDLAKRPEMIELMMEEQWSKLLYQSAERSRVRKKTELLEVLDLETDELNLEDFNEVCLAMEKPNALMWLEDDDPKDKSLGGKILNLLMGSLKQGEGLDSLVHVMREIGATKPFQIFISEKLLVEWFISFGDSEVRMRATEQMAKGVALPLKFQDQRYFKKCQEVRWEWNFELSNCVNDSFGIVNLSIGAKARIGLRSEHLLNRCFLTKFDESGRGLFSEGSVDINIDQNFEKPRDLTFMNVWGETTHVETLKELIPFANLVLIQVSHRDMDTPALEHVIRVVRETEHLEMILVVRESNITSGRESFCENEEEKIGMNFGELNVEREEVVVINDSLQEVISGLGDFEQRFVQRVTKKIKYFKDEGREGKIRQESFGNLVKDRLEQSLKEESDFQMIDQNFGFSKIDYVESRGSKLNKIILAVEKGVNLLNMIQEAIKENRIEELFKEIKIPKSQSTTSEQSTIRELKPIANRETSKSQPLPLSNQENLSLSVNEQIVTLKNKECMDLFLEIVEHKLNAVILMNLSVGLEKINQNLVKPMKNELERLKREFSSDEGDEKETEANKEQIVQLEKRITDSTISLNSLFQNLFQNIDKIDSWIDTNRKNEVKQKIVGLWQKGFSFQLLDQENLVNKSGFVLEQLRGLGKDKLCVVSILGAPRSGKSTILNFMFGTRVHSNWSNCGPGINLSIQRFTNPNNKIKWLVVFEVKGADSPELKDPEFDIQICTSFITMSDIMLVTSKGEMNTKIKSDLKISLSQASKIENFEDLPDIHFIFNQNQGSNEKYRCVNQLLELNQQISSNEEDLLNLNMTKTFDLHERFVWIFGSAFEFKNVNALQMSSDKRGTYNLVSKLFSLMVGELTCKIFNWRLTRCRPQKFKSLETFFLNSQNKCNHFGRSKDQILDKNAFKNWIQSETNLRKWKDQFLVDLDQDIHRNTIRLENNIRVTKSIDKLYSGPSNRLKIIQTDLDLKWNTIKNATVHELRRINFEEEEIKILIQDIKQKYDLKVNNFIYSTEAIIHSRTIQIYDKEEPKYFIERATQLRKNHQILDLRSDRPDIVLKPFISKSFKQDFNEFVIEQEKYLETDNLELRTFETIQEMAKNLIHFQRDELQCPANTEIVTVDWLYQKMAVILTPERNRFLADGVDLKQKQLSMKEWSQRPSNGFMDLSQYISEGVKVEIIRDVTASFQRGVLVDTLAEIVFNEIDSLEIRTQKIGYITGILSKNGIEFEMPEDNLLKEIHEERMKSETWNDSEDIMKLRWEKKPNETIEIGDIKKYLVLESDAVTQKKYARMLKDVEEGNFYWLKELERTMVIDKDQVPGKYHESLRCCFDFSNYKDLQSLQYLMLQIVNFVLKLKRVFQKIEYICYMNICGLKSMISFEDHQKFQYDQETIDCRKAPEFSYLLLQNIVKQEFGLLVQEVEQDLSVCGVRIDLPMKGFLTNATLLFVWKFVVDVKARKISRHINGLRQKRVQYYSLYENIVTNNRPSRILNELEIDIDHVCQRRWEHKMDRAGRVYKDTFYRDFVKDFQSKTIVQNLEKKYFLHSTQDDFEQVFEFLTSPNKIFENEIKRMMDERFVAKIQREERAVKADMKIEMENSIKILQIIKNKMNFGKGDTHSILNNYRIFTEGNQEIILLKDKTAHLDLVSRVAFRMILGMVKGREVSSIYNDPITKIRLELKSNSNVFRTIHSVIKVNGHLQPVFKASRTNRMPQPLCKNLVQILENFNKKQVFSTKNFFNKCIQIFSSKLANFQSLKLGLGDFKVQKMFEEATSNAFGCLERCPFCLKKCESLTADGNHQHHTDLNGHQLRVFAKGYVYRNKQKYSSLLTCDAIACNKMIKWKGNTLTWEEAFKSSKIRNWKLNLGRNIEEIKDQIDNYERVWNMFGPQICQKMGFQHENTTVREFIEKYNGNLSGRPDSHYIMCLDQSGSMSGQKFRNANLGTRDFLNYVRTQVQGTNCRISYFLFDHEYKQVLNFEDINSNIDTKLDQMGFTGEGTRFGPVLDQAIQTIENNCDNMEVHRTLVYTDGYADYPEAQISKLKTIISKAKINFKMFWVCEDDSGETIFQRCIEDMGCEHCEWVKGVPTDNLGSTLIEIFNEDQV